MFKKIFIPVFSLLLIFLFLSCSGEEPAITDDSTNQADSSGNIAVDDTESTAAEAQVESVSPVSWPAEMLPEGFPDLGEVSRVIDSRAFVKSITIYWNTVTQDQVNVIVDKLNEYLDYDHAWQDYFYSDGIKYKQGTEEEFINVVIRYQVDAAGTGEDPQFFLEIRGDGIPDQA